MRVRVLLQPPAPKRLHPAAKLIDWTRWVLLCVGVTALGAFAYVYLDAHIYQQYQDWSFDQESHGRTATVGAFIRDLGSSEEADSEPQASPRPMNVNTSRDARNSGAASLRFSDPRLIGRIEIPRLNVHAIVKEGVDDRTLRRAVGHVPGTVKPGDQGNVGLAGHRDTFFRGLQNIRKSDRIVIETLDSKYEYVVDSLKIVSPDDVEVLAPSTQSVLTLVTCYPFHYVGNAPRRFIVRARQVGVEARDSAIAAPSRTGL